MSLMVDARWKKDGVFVAAIAALCGLLLCLGACSDNKGGDTPTTKDASPQSSAPASSPGPPGQAAPSQAQTQAAVPGTEGKCASLLTAKCTACHNMERICEKLGKKSKSRWQRTITRMVERGAKMEADESAAVLDCLDSGVKELQSVCQ